MSGLRFCMLDYGIIRNKRNIVIDSAAEGEMVDSPIPGFLIEHPVLGRILFDTGNPAGGSSVMGERGKEFDFRKIHMVTECLGELGLDVNSIDRIIISHLHMDHAGGLPCFAGTKAAENGVIISSRELKNARDRVNGEADPGFYAGSTFTNIAGLNWNEIQGTVKLAEDVILFCQEAHTPGVIGMILKTEHHGNFIIASDGCYSIENFETQTPPGGLSDEWKQKFKENLSVLQELQKEYDAKIIFGHDVDQAPEFFNQWFD